LRREVAHLRRENELQRSRLEVFVCLVAVPCVDLAVDARAPLVHERRQAGISWLCRVIGIERTRFFRWRRDQATRVWTTRQAAVRALDTWIGTIYNTERLHSSIGYLTPVRAAARWGWRTATQRTTPSSALASRNDRGVSHFRGRRHRPARPNRRRQFDLDDPDRRGRGSRDRRLPGTRPSASAAWSAWVVEAFTADFPPPRPLRPAGPTGPVPLLDRLAPPAALAGWRAAPAVHHATCSDFLCRKGARARTLAPSRLRVPRSRHARQ
jgi:hypothetical protein